MISQNSKDYRNIYAAELVFVPTIISHLTMPNCFKYILLIMLLCYYFSGFLNAGLVFVMGYSYCSIGTFACLCTIVTYAHQSCFYVF